MSSDESGSESGQEVYVRTLIRRDCICVPTNEGTALAISAAPVYGSEEWNQWNNREVNAIDTNRSIRLDVMMSWRVIGWTEPSGRILLFTHSDVDGNDYRNQYSDTIFPVIGIHVDESHIPGRVGFCPMTYNQEIGAILMQKYRQIMFLTLIQNPVIPSEERVVSVPTDQDYIERTVQSLSAELFCFYHIFDSTGQYIPSAFYKIERILDLYIADYSVIGLLGVGECPEEPRVLWDQTYADLFSWNYYREDRWVERTGYLVSKYSLLVVSEQTPKTISNSLLRDSTYAIIDGISMYYLNYHITDRQVESKFQFSTNTTLGVPYRPKLVVITEGVNLLNVQYYYLKLAVPETQRPPEWRLSWLYLQNPTALPTVIDWFQFESDFERIESMIELPFKLIMNIEDINDYIIVYCEQLDEQYLFSLHYPSIYSVREKKFSDFWNVFVLLDDPYWVYLCSTALVYKDHRFLSPMVYLKPIVERLMTLNLTITDERFQHKEAIVDQIRQYFIRYIDVFPLTLECRQFCQDIGRTPFEQYRNTGLYTHLRFNTMETHGTTFADSPVF